jgi:predicted enzyme related to lactoylglutathione lyase
MKNMKKDLIYINLLSKNSEKLVEFYTKVVGLSPLDNTKNPATETWYGFDTGNTSFAIEPMSNRDKYNFEYNKSNPTLIQFKAGSMEELLAWTERLEKEGAHIGQRILKKSYGIVTTFTDPDGNLAEILYRQSI